MNLKQVKLLISISFQQLAIEEEIQYKIYGYEFNTYTLYTTYQYRSLILTLSLTLENVNHIQKRTLTYSFSYEKRLCKSIKDKCLHSLEIRNLAICSINLELKSAMIDENFKKNYKWFQSMLTWQLHMTFMWTRHRIIF